MSRISRKTRSYVWACVLGLIASGVAGAPQGARAQAVSEQQLKAQEEALLRQLAQAAVEPTANVKLSASSSQSEELSAESLLNREQPLNVASGIQEGETKSHEATELELMIDQQARAALAAIDQAKNSGTAKATTVGTNQIVSNEAASSGALSNSAAQAVNSVQTVPAGYVASVSRSESPVQQVRKLSTELGSRDAELSGVRLELQNAQKRAAAADARAASLSKQVEALRSKLMVAETEVERLSRVLESRNNSNIAQVTGVSSVARGAANGTSSAKAGSAVRSTAAINSPANTVVRERVIVREGKQADDLPVVVVTADKANLRTGPGADNSSLIAVSRGTRLVVETRQGSWFRVFAPNGVRAWVSADTVELQKGAG